MRNFLIVFILLLGLGSQLSAQSLFSQPPEFQLSYFGEFIFHPGVKAGIHFPFSSSTKLKTKQNRKRGRFTKTKFKQLKLGGNIGFYQQKQHLTGYLLNAELTYQRTNNKSFRPNKFSHFEAAIGIGYYRYQLKGTTFTTDGNSFQEKNGNGNALMPSLSVGWGRTLPFIKKTDIRSFVKSSLYLEMAHGTSVLPHYVLEIGFATSLGTRKK